jgi:hypothetical protein
VALAAATTCFSRRSSHSRWRAQIVNLADNLVPIVNLADDLEQIVRVVDDPPGHDP